MAKSGHKTAKTIIFSTMALTKNYESENCVIIWSFMYSSKLSSVPEITILTHSAKVWRFNKVIADTLAAASATGGDGGGQQLPLRRGQCPISHRISPPLVNAKAL